MNLSRIVLVSMNTRPVPVSLFLRGFFTVIFGAKYCRVDQQSCDRSRSLIRLHSDARRSAPSLRPVTFDMVLRWTRAGR
jgi:predicted ATP-grasp superfamily ATP-dependent carboligase